MKGKILIIDDNPIDIKIASKALEASGFDCFGITDHNTLPDWLSHSTPNLILLDLQMPQVSGYEIIAFFRKSAATANVPIIIISGKKQSEDVIKAIKLGANDYIVKPIDPLVLQEKVEKMSYTHQSEYHSLNLSHKNELAVYISNPTQIISMSEFGVQIRCERNVELGEVLLLTGLNTEIFGKDSVLVRCLNSQIQNNLCIAETTFVGTTEAQRQLIRKYCHQMYVKSQKELT